jgi:hypothetical protein
VNAGALTHVRATVDENPDMISIPKLIKAAALPSRVWALLGAVAARRRQIVPLVGAAAAGAGLEYLLDPERGAHRRHVIHARVNRIVGRSRGALHTLSSEPLDDAGLAHKVESMLFRDPKIPKGDININAENGTVFVRGQIDSEELIDDVMESVREIAGVDKAVNLMHLPGTPAPHPATAAPAGTP